MSHDDHQVGRIAFGPEHLRPVGPPDDPIGFRMSPEMADALAQAAFAPGGLFGPRDGGMRWADPATLTPAEQAARQAAEAEQARQAEEHEAHRVQMEVRQLDGLRDTLAGQVLNGLVAHKTLDQIEQEPNGNGRIARIAYDLADAMLAERHRRRASEEA